MLNEPSADDIASVDSEGATDIRFRSNTSLLLAAVMVGEFGRESEGGRGKGFSDLSSMREISSIDGSGEYVSR